MTSLMEGRGPYEVRIIEDRWATFRHVIEAVAILAAGAWAFYTFVYQEKIKPANEPAALTLTLEVSSLGHDRARDNLSLTVVMVNAGKTEIDIAADGYNVWGRRYGPRRTVRIWQQGTQRSYDNDLPIVSNHLITAAAELRDAAVDGDKGRHIILEPGATERLTWVFAIPRGAYDIIHAKAIAVPVKTGSPRVRVLILPDTAGGYRLNAINSFEDDNSTDFVIPQ
jgi:hypothetical protein